ncbi:MAG: arginase family protein [Thaumarchaeota archaeon]|jgi:agmatinase|nr:arginase family protein [Candidatus Terraquivivens yellowstonensis]
MGRPLITNIYSREESNVIAFGVILGRKAAESVNAIREASWFIEVFDIASKRNLLERARVYDIGDIKLTSYDDLKNVTKTTSSILSEGKLPLMLGGGHLATYHALKAMPKDVILLVFDAHCDLRESYMDEKIVELDYINESTMIDKKLNDATWLRWASEEKMFKKAAVIGVRSGDEEQLVYAKKNGILLITSEKLLSRNGLNAAAKILSNLTKGRKVYLSLDIDVFDPSIAPAVDHPEPLGISFREFTKLIKSIKGRIVGCDVVCLRKIPDNEVTEFLAARAIFEILYYAT